jgi:hypothetical protein
MVTSVVAPEMCVLRVKGVGPHIPGRAQQGVEGVVVAEKPAYVPHILSEKPATEEVRQKGIRRRQGTEKNRRINVLML